MNRHFLDEKCLSAVKIVQTLKWSRGVVRLPRDCIFGVELYKEVVSKETATIHSTEVLLLVGGKGPMMVTV